MIEMRVYMPALLLMVWAVLAACGLVLTAVMVPLEVAACAVMADELWRRYEDL